MTIRRKNYRFNFRAYQIAPLNTWTHSEHREEKKMTDMVQIQVNLFLQASFYPWCKFTDMVTIHPHHQLWRQEATKTLDSELGQKGPSAAEIKIHF